ncbi:hypothetical protein EYF80_055403 [Liparis tanakae]|uniref:Uncharacterized protein n=1 Tax=Liparis tanakae TaxID=230148 RepID=A0A4Z2F0Z9_9TELE|nr:hypothetical protein EYF80_055403 [Liparis tanakae]
MQASGTRPLHVEPLDDPEEFFASLKASVTRTPAAPPEPPAAGRLAAAWLLGSRGRRAAGCGFPLDGGGALRSGGGPAAALSALCSRLSTLSHISHSRSSSAGSSQTGSAEKNDDRSSSSGRAGAAGGAAAAASAGKLRDVFAAVGSEALGGTGGSRAENRFCGASPAAAPRSFGSVRVLWKETFGLGSSVNVALRLPVWTAAPAGLPRGFWVELSRGAAKLWGFWVISNANEALSRSSFSQSSSNSSGAAAETPDAAPCVGAAGFPAASLGAGRTGDGRADDPGLRPPLKNCVGPSNRKSRSSSISGSGRRSAGPLAAGRRLAGNEAALGSASSRSEPASSD